MNLAGGKRRLPTFDDMDNRPQILRWNRPDWAIHTETPARRPSPTPHSSHENRPSRLDSQQLSIIAQIQDIEWTLRGLNSTYQEHESYWNELELNTSRMRDSINHLQAVTEVQRLRRERARAQSTTSEEH